MRSRPETLGLSWSQWAMAIKKTLGRAARQPFWLLRSSGLRLREQFLEIPSSIITDQYAFSYADSGWNLFREIAACHEKNPNVELRDTTFFRFFQDDRVRSVRCLNDVLFLHDPGKRSACAPHEFYLGTMPWGEWFKRDVATGGVPWGHYYDAIEGASTRDLYGYRNNPWYEPGDEHSLVHEWEHTVDVFGSVRRGYRPILYGSYPEVVLLVRRDGARRAVVVQGQHRVAALTQLGYQKIPMMITRESMGTIHEEDVEQWCFVRSKRCSPEQALMIFHAFFELSGRERARSTGLSPSY